jgi:hypothetical protein
VSACNHAASLAGEGTRRLAIVVSR